MLAIPIAVVGSSIIGFAWRHLKQTPAALVLMVLGALLYLSVPVQEYVEVTLVGLSGGPQQFVRPALHTVLEEGAELLGTFCFLSSGIVYALFSTEGGFARRPVLKQELRLILDPVRFRRVALRAIALLGAILLVTAFVILPSLPIRHAVKGPLGWFAAMMAFLTAVGSLHIVASRRRLAGRRRVEGATLIVLSVFSLALSADFGTGQLLTRRVWYTFFPTSTAHLVVVIFAVAAALALSGGLSRIWRGRARGAAVGWGVLMSVAFLSNPVDAVIWAFAAYALMIPALLDAAGLDAIHGAPSAPLLATGHIPVCPSPSSTPSSDRILAGVGLRVDLPLHGANDSPRYGTSPDSFDSSGKPNRGM